MCAIYKSGSLPRYFSGNKISVVAVYKKQGWQAKEVGLLGKEKVSEEKWHTVMGQEDYKRCLAPEFHQEPVYHLHSPLPSSNVRILWVLSLGLIIVI